MAELVLDWEKNLSSSFGCSVHFLLERQGAPLPAGIHAGLVHIYMCESSLFCPPDSVVVKFFFINFHTSNAKLNPQNHLFIRAGEGSVKFTLILAEYLIDYPMRSLQIDESCIINICIQQ